MRENKKPPCSSGSPTTTRHTHGDTKLWIRREWMDDTHYARVQQKYHVLGQAKAGCKDAPPRSPCCFSARRVPDGRGPKNKKPSAVPTPKQACGNAGTYGKPINASEKKAHDTRAMLRGYRLDAKTHPGNKVYPSALLLLFFLLRDRHAASLFLYPSREEMGCGLREMV